jgi:pimeloyl-ACP methyl ester carboxylesterase
MLEYRTKLSGCQCSVVEWNPDAKTPILALHGWLDNLASFESLAKYLPDYRIIAVDFPGHGHSDHIEEGRTYHFIDGLYLIDDLIEFLELKSVNLLGHSMGGAIATIYAATQPSRVAKLALIEALGPVTSPVSASSSMIGKALSQRRGLKDKRKPIYPNFELALNARAEVSEVEPLLIKPIVERGLLRLADQKGYTWRADSRLRIPSAMRMGEQQLRSIISNITCPSLMIEAKSGLLVKEEAKYIQERKPLVPQLEIHQIPGSHHPHLETPEEIAKLISRFLA